jgi:hypothetical protein
MEKSMLVHMCRKQRFLEKDEKHVRFGFWIYQKFWSMNYGKNIIKPFNDFSESQFYIAFIKFAKYIHHINAVNPEMFVEFILKSGLKVDDWTKPHVYEVYLREMNKREDALSAMNRNFLLMQQWAKETGEEWTDFFRKVSYGSRRAGLVLGFSTQPTARRTF